MKKVLLMLVAVLGVFALTSVSKADDKAGSVDNRLVDGNWFAIASDEGPGFGVPGDKVVDELKTQVEQYQNAVDAEDIVKAEHYAVRTWVKGMYALEQGRQALNKGDLQGAKEAYLRAKNYGKAAQKKGAGLGSKNPDESAAQGKAVVNYAKKALLKINKKIAKSAAPADASDDASAPADGAEAPADSE